MFSVYEHIFEFFDSIPPVTFFIDFTFTYFLLHYLIFTVLLWNKKFSNVRYDKQTFIVINLLESLLLGFMRLGYKIFSNNN